MYIGINTQHLQQFSAIFLETIFVNTSQRLPRQTTLKNEASNIVQNNLNFYLKPY